MIVKGLAVGLIAGILYGLLGYLKSGEEFNARKFFKTLIIGAILGALNYGLGLGITGDDIMVMALAGETALIQFVIKIFENWRARA